MRTLKSIMLWVEASAPFLIRAAISGSDSLTVPTRALYNQMGQTGVVIVDEYGNNYFTQVTVISTQGDITHIIPKNSGVLYEGTLVKLF